MVPSEGENILLHDLERLTMNLAMNLSFLISEIKVLCFTCSLPPAASKIRLKRPFNEF